MKTKTFFLDENWVFLIPDLYLYGIKIQINIKQNSVTKYTGKLQIFSKIFFLKIFGTRPDPAKKKDWAKIKPKNKIRSPFYRAGLSPAAWAGLMFQPVRTGLFAGYCAPVLSTVTSEL
jgi:hypothetical protein